MMPKAQWAPGSSAEARAGLSGCQSRQAAWLLYTQHGHRRSGGAGHNSPHPPIPHCPPTPPQNPKQGITGRAGGQTQQHRTLARPGHLSSDGEPTVQTPASLKLLVLPLPTTCAAALGGAQRPSHSSGPRSTPDAPLLIMQGQAGWVPGTRHLVWQRGQ